MLSLVIAILIILLVVYAAFWIIDNAGVPHPFNMILKVVIGIIALIALLQKAGMLNGVAL
jgi:hypothetical protein